jgi:hypothetical protein
VNTFRLPLSPYNAPRSYGHALYSIFSGLPWTRPQRLPRASRPSLHVRKSGQVLLPLLLANYIASGDEIAFTVPAHDAVGPEVYVTKASSAKTSNCLYLVPIGRVSQPKLDKRDQSFVSAHVRNGGLGISCVFLACEALRDCFYRVPSNGGNLSSPLYTKRCILGRLLLSQKFGSHSNCGLWN